MLDSNSLPEIKIKQISEVKIGETVANLGEILEIEKTTDFYSLIIARLGEKQVIKFKKQTFLLIISSENAIQMDMGEGNKGG